MGVPTLKSALHYASQNPRLTEADRAHIKRWLAEADDPVWEKIAADIELYDKLPQLVEGPFSYFIGSALHCRRLVETMDHPSVQRRQKEENEQQHRNGLLALAAEMQEVSRHYRAWLLEGPPDSNLPSDPLTINELEEKNALKWLEEKALELIRRTDWIPQSDPEWDCVPVNVSRQNGGKSKRRRSREVGYFIRHMVNCLNRVCGKPRHQAVAIITNIAFPGEDVDPEDVRSICRPTTRTARKTGALKQ